MECLASIPMISSSGYDTAEKEWKSNEDINNSSNNTIMETKEQLADNWYEENKFKSDCPRDKQSFIEGFSAKTKLTDKIILNTLNKLRSELSNEQTPKLGRTANFEKQVYYKACIEVLLEI